ncbi:MAG: hypothetical protein HY529_06055 [Chloroflexi bacterium]|nr:hypothetical protein [Chloroflexota bacterium]
MKKILGLTVAALLTMSLVGGGTWAYFSDTESSSNNILAAGTLDLNLNGGNSAVTTFSASAVAPSSSGNGNVTLKNVGSLNGELDIVFSTINNTPGAGGGEYEGGSGELGASAQIAVYIDVDESGAWSSGDIGLKSDNTTYAYPTTLNYAAINSYGSRTWDAVETMVASAQDKLAVLWQVPTSAGNDIQGDSVSFDITFRIEQAAAD